MRISGGFVTAVAFLLVLHYSSACNEALCASVVSKCMLTQSCKCELKKGNCTCCKDCFNCLDKLYVECCSCVEMCPKPNNTESNLNKKSHVEDLTDSIPDLFSALTETCDALTRWTAFTYPAHKGVSFFKDFQYSTGTASRDETGKIKEEEFPEVNCTVAYMSQCMSWEKCKRSCESMGAVSYRWFHDGCCECVGRHCLNYGINESRCFDCSKDKDGEYKILVAGAGETLVDGDCESDGPKLISIASTSEEYTEIKQAEIRRGI